MQSEEWPSLPPATTEGGSCPPILCWTSIGRRGRRGWHGGCALPRGDPPGLAHRPPRRMPCLPWAVGPGIATPVPMGRCPEARCFAGGPAWCRACRAGVRPMRRRCSGPHTWRGCNSPRQQSIRRHRRPGRGSAIHDWPGPWRGSVRGGEGVLHIPQVVDQQGPQFQAVDQNVHGDGAFRRLVRAPLLSDLVALVDAPRLRLERVLNLEVSTRSGRRAPPHPDTKRQDHAFIVIHGSRWGTSPAARTGISFAGRPRWIRCPARRGLGSRV